MCIYIYYESIACKAHGLGCGFLSNVVLILPICVHCGIEILQVDNVIDNYAPVYL